MAYSGPYPLPIIAGGTNKTSIPIFSAYNSSTRANVTGNGTNYIVEFDTEIEDNTNSYDNATFTFTAPVTGLYFFNTTIALSGLISSHTEGSLYFNQNIGPQIVLFNNPFAMSTSGSLKYNASTILQMTALDTMNILLNINSGTLVVDVEGGALPVRTVFSGYLLI